MTAQVVKRDLSLAMDVSADNETSKAKSVKYPVRAAMGGATPKDFLVVYDGDYRQAGLAYLLDIADKFRFADTTHESDVNRLFGAYWIKYRVGDKIDLPIYIGASQIVYCLSNSKPLSGIALYGLAWSSMRWTDEHVSRLRSLSIHKTVKSKATV